MRDHNGQLGLARMRDHNGQLGSQDRDWLKRTAQLCQIDEIACSDGHLVHNHSIRKGMKGHVENRRAATTSAHP